jgi:hypothetical protein
MEFARANRTPEKRRSSAASAIMVLVACALASAGCAGSRPPSKASAAPTNDPAAAKAPASFIAHAEAICTHLNAALAHAAEEQRSNFVRSSQRNAALEGATAEQLSSLTPPASLVGTWRRMNAYRHTLAADLVRLAKSASTHDNKQLQVLAESKQRAHLQLSDLASAAGFKDCAQVGPAVKAAPTPSPSSSKPGEQSGRG